MSDRRIKIESDPAVAEVRKYLMEYSVFRRSVELGTKAAKDFANPTYISKKHIGKPIDPPVASVEMFEIRRFVNSLGGDERVLLFLHYIHGETLEKCAERMALSRISVYRLHRKALELAAAHFGKYKEQLGKVTVYE